MGVGQEKSIYRFISGVLFIKSFATGEHSRFHQFRSVKICVFLDLKPHTIFLYKRHANIMDNSGVPGHYFDTYTANLMTTTMDDNPH